MIDFFRKLFNPTPSSATAKERLRLVLLSDHLSLAPDVIDALKRELIAVISRYVEVDEHQVDVTFEQKDRAVAMLAEIPIISMKPERDGTRNKEPAAGATVPVSAAEPAPATATQTGLPAGAQNTGPNDAVKKKPRRRRKRARSTSETVTAV